MSQVHPHQSGHFAIESTDCTHSLGCVGSSHPEVNPEARATRVSRAGTRMPMTMHLHQEGKPVMEVLQELPQELPLMTHERTYTQVVVGHRPPRSENFKPLTPCSKTL